MPLLDVYRVVRDSSRDQRNALQANHSKLTYRLVDVVLRTWDLGFTAFGGPPVHFKIIHERFVEGRGGRAPWIDEQTYQELFAVCQALPGPASTKMLFCCVLVHAGLVPALIVFLIWCLPGAIGMAALAVGVSNINNQLPDPVYALLSGLNSATVGIIALAAVQLAEKAIKDKLTRILVIGSACAGLCYASLWYFPVLVVIGGIAAVLWDLLLKDLVNAQLKRFGKQKSDQQAATEENRAEAITKPQPRSDVPRQSGPGSRGNDEIVSTVAHNQGVEKYELPQNSPTDDETKRAKKETSVTEKIHPMSHAIPVRVGLVILLVFFASFVTIMVIRSTITLATRPLSLFANMYLAGTIIFGGGPVVIPLLREYVVEPGWVSSRDFLIGLAIIQAFPGPNFNFAVFLGTLSFRGTPYPALGGAVLAMLGIFTPGITLAIAFQSIWRKLRQYDIVISALRGINAAAVGLVFTAVFRLWEIGYLTPGEASGRSLGREPFWVVVATLTYAANGWFKVPAAVAIVMGGALGMCWYGAVGFSP